MRWKARRKGEEITNEPLFTEDEDEQRKEQWSYVESMYFTFISILTVGFGDFRPSSNNPDHIKLVIATFQKLNNLIVIEIIGGVVLTTMCMDVVGRMYLKEIHYLGRKLKSSNPFYLIREAKARYLLPQCVIFAY
ncbi:Ion channel [Ostertagia ostertagi]